MDYTSLVLSQCRTICFKVPEARVMKDRCRQLGQRVNSVEEMVRALQNRPSGSITSEVGGALQRLYTTLMSADTLVQKCTVNRMVNKSKYKSEFNVVDQRLQDSLRVLATVPHMNHAPFRGHAPSTSQAAQQRYTVAVLDDSDDDLGILVPYPRGGAVAPAPRNPFASSAQAGLQYEAVVLVDGENVIVAEHITGRF